MGKGDVKSQKGKRWRKSYGNTRRQKASKTVAAKSAAPKKKAAKK
jgi:ribosomal small subunit protein bTHX